MSEKMPAIPAAARRKDMQDGIARWYIGALSRTGERSAQMPGLNLVRIADYTFGPPASYAAFVNTMTAAKVVVVFENHDPNQTVYTGTQLANEQAWYSSIATYYLGNPYVWFQTMNEPGENDYVQMQDTYNTIRATGNNNIVVIEASFGAAANPALLGSTTFTNTMHNVVWDMHCYNGTSGFSTSVATIQAIRNGTQPAVNSPANQGGINGNIELMQTVTSADGIMPAICLETGNSTNGTTIDAGATEEIQATFTNPNYVGVAAWVWDSLYANTPPDNLTNPGGSSLDAYGQQVAGYIADGASTFAVSAAPGPISGATASTYVPQTSDIGNMLSVSVTAHLSGLASAPATSAGTLIASQGLSKDFFGLAILGPIETNIGGTGEPIL